MITVASHQLINQTSGEFEYYTDPRIICAARLTMGGIDLDPASSAQANKIVKADRFYTERDNGLNFVWHGRIWMNHPFHRGEEVCDPVKCKKKICKERGYHCAKRIPSNKEWIDKLINDYLVGLCKQFCCITYAATSETWFRPLLDFPMLFLYPRTNYYLPDGTIKKGVTKGSIVTYGGPNIDAFEEHFKSFGKVKI
jgi:hypothetical protein